ncbi:hypothetical protein HELRODRAFT_163951 [Helobdella robusta]|uniref:Uncharacterized protein n=1 Tax=Helobdella robusta TaxID=6412 RepID=T1EUN3_HELRO|nr:hypothetical protein HELRODRAFT_163951 [Helobdella robusta]ESN94165.1 hypothetical protein HELRODRAFT_163951 [Helobdella robusta]
MYKDEENIRKTIDANKETWTTVVRKVPCENRDIKSVFRRGKIKKGENRRPLLKKFLDGTLKKRVLENLSKLRNADKNFSMISVTLNMTNRKRPMPRASEEVKN